MTLDSDLATLWRRAERSLTADLERVARELTQARARGQVVNVGTLASSKAYLTLAAQLGTEARRFGGTAAVEIARAADADARLGASEVRGYLKALGVADYRTSPVQSATPRSGAFVDRQATYRWLLDNGVPADALDGMQRALLDAVQRGQSASACVTAAKLGMARGLSRALLVSRDQTARAYRESADAEMTASGQVAMKQRIVQRAGACAACLAKDGETIPVSEPGYDHAGGRCKWRPVLVGKAPVRRSAESWLRQQSAEYQRDLLGQARYEAFRDGRISLASVAVTTEHPIYGRGLRVAPLPPQTQQPVASQ